MAKADFCFNFYDGDATRDMAHMNRLERGAYTDVIIQQRQRGRLSIEDIKRFLSKDFETVWPALEWILKKDAAGKYFIEWLETSEKKAKAHSLKQKENREKALTKYEPIINQTSTKHQPTTPSGQPSVEPLGNGNGNEDVIEVKKKKKKGVEIIYPFTSDEFLSAWCKWKQYRKEIKKPYRSALSEQMALQKLAIHPEGVAIKIIEDSIESQWQGLYEKQQTYVNGNTPTRTPQPSTTIIETGKSFGLEKGFSRSGSDGRRN